MTCDQETELSSETASSGGLGINTLNEQKKIEENIK